MQELRQSTEMKVRVGSAVDATDGVTPETGLTLGAADQAELLKHNGAATVDISAATFAAVTAVDGWYDLTLTTSHTDTLGQLTVVIQDSSLMAPIFRDFMVVTANYWDSKYSTDVLQVDVTQWLGTAAATPTVAGVPEVDLTHWLGTGVSVNVAGKPTVDVTNIGASSQSLIDLKDFADSCYDPTNNKVQSDLIYIHGSALTETAGQLAAGFIKLFDVATPLLVASDVMRGTDNAALAATALLNTTWTDAKAAFIDHSIATVDTNVDTLLTRITAARAGYLDNLSAGAVALASALATAQTDLDTITGTDGVTLATLQALYAPNKVIPDVAGTAAGLHSTTDGKIDTVDTNVDSILADTGTDGVLLATAATSAQLVDDVWDELITGALHNISTSAGRRLLELGAYHISSGTAQAASAHSITLAADAGAVDHILNRNLIVIQAGTGTGQTRTIVDYNGTTKVAVIDRDWVTNPDATSEYSIIPDDTPLVANHGVATAGTSTTITISTTASAISSTYSKSIIQIMAGTGAGQSQLIDSYNGTTKVVTICGTWTTIPDNTSVYVILPYGVSIACNIATDALALINTECDTALTDYDPPTRTEATADKDAIITEVNANETKIDALQTDSTAIKAKTDNLPSGISKNVALPKFDIYMVLNSDHVTAATGKTITGQISKDGGAFAGITNVISEVGNGMYTIASGFTQTEMNADVITLKFTETDCDQRIITIYTS